jgi:hypothetical protein
MDYSKIPEYLLGYLDAFRAYVDANQRDMVAILWGAMLFVFLLAWRALRRVRRLGSELEELRQSTQRLFAAEEARLMRDLRNGHRTDARR